LNRGTSRKANAKQGTCKTIGAYYSRLYYKITIGPRLQCYTSGMRSANKDDALYSNSREDIGRKVGKVVQGLCMKTTWIA